MSMLRRSLKRSTGKGALITGLLFVALVSTSHAAGMKHCGTFKWPTPAQIAARGINCHAARDIASRSITNSQQGKDPFYVRSPRGSLYRCTQLGGDGYGGLVCKRKSVRVELRIL